MPPSKTDWLLGRTPKMNERKAKAAEFQAARHDRKSGSWRRRTTKHVRQAELLRDEAAQLRGRNAQDDIA